MKTDFIKIGTIDEIDTSKISVYDLNKRFIDDEGNMYGLRYNRLKRKVEIIRVLRTSNDRAQMIRSRLLEKKQKERHISENERTKQHVEELAEEAELHRFDETEGSFVQLEDATSDQPGELSTIEQELDQINPDIFLQEMFRNINTHRERFSGIMHNIQNSKMVTHDDRELFNRYEEISRTLDIDGFQKLDTIIALYREITEYPRPISFYLTHLDPRARDLLNTISTDKGKYRYILLCEMDMNLKHVYKTLLAIAEKTFDFIDDLEAMLSSKAGAPERQSLADARFTLDSTFKEIKGVLTKLTALEQYVRVADNFVA